MRLMMKVILKRKNESIKLHRSSGSTNLSLPHFVEKRLTCHEGSKNLILCQEQNR